MKYKDELLRSKLIERKRLGKEPLSEEEKELLEKLEKEASEDMKKEMQRKIDYLYLLQKENYRDVRDS